MKKKEMVKKMKEDSVTDANFAYDTFMSILNEALLAGEDVTLNGIGTFKVAERKARVGRNPKTGESIDIAAKKALTFKASKTIKDLLNG